MAELHHGASISPRKIELIAPWISRQRWYAAKGREPRLRQLWSWRLDDPDGEVGIETILAADESAAEAVVYQVPLTYRSAPLPDADHALLGTMEHSVLGRRWVYDGPHDPVYAAQLLELVYGRAQAASARESAAPEPDVTGHRHPHAPDVRPGPSRVLSGEQSNTSIIYDTTGPDGAPKPLICKVFRTLQSGDNPDVVVQSALAETGTLRVPGMAGWVAAQWPAPAADGAAHGQVAFAQEFYPGTEDAWRVALRAVADDADFTGPARELGAATAEVHALLAEAMPVEPATPEAIGAVITGMRARYVAAASEVPAIAAYDYEIADVFAAARDASWPVLQRIHGDFHLGQVLTVPGRGWVLLDFEGEPLRSLAERSRPDLPARDIAGMLRSFDYAAGSWEQAHPEGRRRDWADACQHAFLDGYAGRSGRDPRADTALLTALQLDKALYEVVYEARNRPSWLTIPTDAVVRLLDDARKANR